MILFNQYQNHGFVCWSSILIFIPSSPGLSFRSGTISDKFFEEGSVQCKQQKEKDMDMDWAEIIIDRWFGIWMMIKDRKMSVVVKKIFLFCKKVSSCYSLGACWSYVSPQKPKSPPAQSRYKVVTKVTCSQFRHNWTSADRAPKLRRQEALSGSADVLWGGARAQLRL